MIRASRFVCRLAALTIAAWCAWGSVVSAAQEKQPAQPPAATDIFGPAVDRYRAGDMAGALGEIEKLYVSKEGPIGMRHAVEKLRDDKARGRLECVLFLQSAAFFEKWAANGFPGGAPPARVLILTHLYRAVRSLDDKSKFMLAWHLTWESFRQLSTHQPVPASLDFLREALDSFPRHSEILLAAGSREELFWWGSFNNVHRDPRGKANNTRVSLLAARDAFRRSLRANDEEVEARLRLIRILLQLDELDEAEREILRLKQQPSGEIFQYLLLLFEGDLYERKGDTAAAMRAYEAAVPLAMFPHAALVARAQLAYRTGGRVDAIDRLKPVMTGPMEHNDPYWIYLRGQTWRYEIYLRALRKLATP
jgi:tetratricopeptide (TPR) repeat protein